MPILTFVGYIEFMLELQNQYSNILDKIEHRIPQFSSKISQITYEDMSTVYGEKCPSYNTTKQWGKIKKS